jgi:phospholipase D1/2
MYSLYQMSDWTIQYFRQMHPNFHIASHPGVGLNIYSHHEKLLVADTKYAFVGGIDLCFGRGEAPGYPIGEPIPGKNYFPGIDYSNMRVADFHDIDKWEKNTDFDKSKVPRVPWRDIHCRLEGPIIHQYKRHFAQYWNYVNVPVTTYPWILKASTDYLQRIDMFTKVTKIKSNTEGYIIKEVRDKKKVRMGLTVNTFPITRTPMANDFECQSLRSVSYWSLGLPRTNPERSIYDTYIEMIRKANHFIYIENQFFISRTDDKEIIKNEIVNELAKKVIEKILSNQKFLLVIVIPQVPGFAGDIKGQPGVLLRAMFELYLQTIYKSERSLIRQISKVTPNWENYVKIFGLRNHGIVGGVPHTEIVYVHSKLMIVDDDVAIMGSANINDRSLLGDRDSEIAVKFFQHYKDKYSTLAGLPFSKSPGVHDLRKRCWQTLFGITDIGMLEDPLSPDTISAIDKQAAINDQVYWNLFQDFPHDTLKYVKTIPQRRVPPMDEYLREVQKIRGVHVNYPLLFLDSEDIKNYGYLDVVADIMPVKLLA